MTDRLVVDTDVVSFVFKGDTRAKVYEPHPKGRQLVVSFMTVAELYRWTEERNWGLKQIAALEAHLRNFVVHPVDPYLWQIWGRIMTEGKKNGKVIACADGWIAATALANGIPLVSYNGKHYSGIAGLSIVCETSTTFFLTDGSLSDKLSTCNSSLLQATTSLSIFPLSLARF